MVLRYITKATTWVTPQLEDRCLNALLAKGPAMGIPEATVAEGILKNKEAAIALVHNKNSNDTGDCSAVANEIGSYVVRVDAITNSRQQRN